MAHWTVEAPTSLDFDDVTELRVRLVAGAVAVLAAGGKPSLEVGSVTGEPLTVTHEDGVLTIVHDNLTWDGLLKWLRPERHSATVTVTVPRACSAQVGVISATAVLSGLGARATFKSVSGGMTLDGGWLERLDANTVSGDVTADVDLDPLGGMQINTVSGEVTLRLPAEADARISLHSVTGDVRSEFEELRRSRGPASHSVSGSLGAGSGRVGVTAMSGQVMLLRRAERGTMNEMEGEAS